VAARDKAAASRGHEVNDWRRDEMAVRGQSEQPCPSGLGCLLVRWKASPGCHGQRPWIWARRKSRDSAFATRASSFHLDFMQGYDKLRANGRRKRRAIVAQRRAGRCGLVWGGG
jgi:hypothetical protein